MSRGAATMFHDETIYDSLEKIVIDDRAYLGRRYDGPFSVFRLVVLINSHRIALRTRTP
jgi:hypothetical protein